MTATDPVLRDVGADSAVRTDGIVRRTLRELVRNPGGLIGLTLVGLVVLVAVLAPVLAPYDPLLQETGPRLAPPSSAHLTGTDQFGRDLFSRLIFGARISVGVGFGAVSIGAIIGTIAGLWSGFLGGWLDGILGRVWDVAFAFPGILLGILIVAITGPGVSGVAVAVVVVNIPVFARVSRASVMRERELEYVDASRVLGLANWRITFVDVLPNILGPLVVQFTISVGLAVLLESALSFLGLGTQPPQPSWGTMLNESRRFLRQAPWAGVFPGLGLAVLLVGLNQLADALRELLDPRGGGQ